ncbi:MAG: hypothetical protein AAFW65_02385 [Pseudomonadota bacterium]
MSDKTPKEEQKEGKAARLSEALRANLKRRKQAARKSAEPSAGKDKPSQT